MCIVIRMVKASKGKKGKTLFYMINKNTFQYLSFDTERKRQNRFKSMESLIDTSVFLLKSFENESDLVDYIENLKGKKDRVVVKTEPTEKEEHSSQDDAVASSSESDNTLSSTSTDSSSERKAKKKKKYRKKKKSRSRSKKRKPIEEEPSSSEDESTKKKKRKKRKKKLSKKCQDSSSSESSDDDSWSDESNDSRSKKKKHRKHFRGTKKSNSSIDYSSDSDESRKSPQKTRHRSKSNSTKAKDNVMALEIKESPESKVVVSPTPSQSPAEHNRIQKHFTLQKCIFLFVFSGSMKGGMLFLLTSLTLIMRAEKILIGFSNLKFLKECFLLTKMVIWKGTTNKF